MKFYVKQLFAAEIKAEKHVWFMSHIHMYHIWISVFSYVVV